MLSKTSIIILGLLVERNMSAYDMCSRIDSMNMKYWHSIGATTLYETCIRLQKKGLIATTEESDRKTMYELTARGLSELQETIRELFNRVDFDSIWFTLAYMFSGVIPKDELIKLKEQRMELLCDYEIGIQKQLNKMKEMGIPFERVSAVQRMYQIVLVEKEFLMSIEHICK